MFAQIKTLFFCKQYRVRRYFFSVLIALAVPSLAGAAVPLNNVKLNAPLVEREHMSSYAVSSDSQWLVYSTKDRRTMDPEYRLYSRAMDGTGEPVKLHHSKGLLLVATSTILSVITSVWTVNA